MKITTNKLLLGGLILGGGYLLYKYFTPKKIADVVTQKGVNYIMGLPKEYYTREKTFIFSEDIKENVIGSAQTEHFLNLVGIITRVNPFTKSISPIIDFAMSKTSNMINSWVGK